MGSFVANCVLIGMVLLSLQPRPTVKQDEHRAEMQITSKSVPRNRPTLSTARGDVLLEAAAATDSVQSGTVPTTRAEAIAAPASNVRAHFAAGERVENIESASLSSAPVVSEPSGQTAPLAAPAATSAIASDVTPDHIKQGRIVAPEIPVAKIRPDIEVSQAPAAALTIQTDEPDSEPLGTVKTSADVLMAAPKSSATVEASIANAPIDTIRASFALPGAEGQNVDPQSLAAYSRLLDAA